MSTCDKELGQERLKQSSQSETIFNDNIQVVLQKITVPSMEKIMYCLMFSKLEAVVSPRTTEAVRGVGMGTTPHASRTSVPLLQKLGR